MIEALARDLIGLAKEKGAQDLYLLPRGDQHEVSIRTGEERLLLGYYEASTASSLISHFKFVAGMNVGERRRPQLGACDYPLADGQVSLRLSTVGDYRGQESLVVRLLFDGVRALSYWFDGWQKAEQAIGSRGLYLFAGPVGSGKTTLMHQLVGHCFAGQQVISIEDPVEIRQEGFLQLQLNESIGMTYDSLIKLSLRHRPDVLLIGEIRDKETARAVVRASLTGAVVFSTVHAKSIPGVYARLLELGVSPEELANCLAGVCYQRLIGQGGLIDVATRDFTTHSPACWNQQIEQLVADGHLSPHQAATEKIKPA